MNIIIVDDHEIVREGFKKVLSQQKDLIVVATASTIDEMFRQLLITEVDLIMLDISLPNRSGLDCIKEIKTLHSEVKIIMFSVFPDDKFALRAIKTGADGYINKNSSSFEIINAIKKVMSGGKYLKSEMIDELLINPDKAFNSITHEILSDREFEVLRLIASGLKMNQIAAKLNLSVNTIASYKERIQEKLNLKSIADLTRYAIENKLIE